MVNGETTVRLYANNTFNITGSAPIAKVVFTINTTQCAVLAASTGNVGEQTAEDTLVTWNGNTTDVTFTVGAKSIADTSKAGQFRISKIEIYPAK